MANVVRLTVLTGPHRDQRVCFRGHTSCIVGRGPGCDMQLVGAARDQSISRWHCQLDIDLPCVSVHDLHSRNGTHLNGKAVPTENTLDATVPWPPEDVFQGNLESGDILTIGGTSFRVDLLDCQHAEMGGPQPAEPWQGNKIENCSIPCE